jgi:epoxide hydrolase 4
MWRPERVAHLAILNAPHPAAFLRELRHNARQRLKSWYVLFFQLPRLPELLLGRDGCLLLAEAIRRSAVNQAAFPDEQLAVYRQAFSQPGALSAALAYYRALGRFGFRRLSRAVRPITCPTLIIWGEQDAALVPELTDDLAPWVPNLRVRRVPSSGHWVQQEAPDLVNAELISFMASAHH